MPKILLLLQLDRSKFSSVVFRGWPFESTSGRCISWSGRTDLYNLWKVSAWSILDVRFIQLIINSSETGNITVVRGSSKATMLSIDVWSISWPIIGEVTRDWDYFKISKQIKVDLDAHLGISELVVIVSHDAYLAVARPNIISAAPSPRSLRIQFEKRRHGRICYWWFTNASSRQDRAVEGFWPCGWSNNAQQWWKGNLDC